MAAAALSLPATTAHALSAAPDGPPSSHANERAEAARDRTSQRDEGSEADTTAPLPPRITLAAPYTSCVTVCQAAGGPGVRATFTFAPNTADKDIVGYRYHVIGEATWSSVTGETATVTHVPQQGGLYRLEVQAFDQVGRAGAAAEVEFLVATGETPLGRWRFDEASGPARDSATAEGTTRNDATLSGGATRDDRGRRGVQTHDEYEALPEPVTDRGLTLDGSGGYAATSAPVLDTRSSFTLSAWVRPDTLGATDRTVLAQDGGFRLSYDATRGTWTFRPSLPAGADHLTLAADRQATPGVWTHLAAVYDASADRTRLYVNGRLRATGTAPGVGAADGQLQFGRALLDGSPGEYGDFFDGSLDEVAVWRRPLTDSEIADEAQIPNGGRNAVELVADWSADGASGTALTDTVSGYGPRLTLSGGAALDGSTLTLDGANGAAAADGPLVDGTGSFTVSTDVTLDGSAVASWPKGRVGHVLGWRAADGSTFGLWYEAGGMTPAWDPDALEEKLVPVGSWRFGRLDADGTYVASSSADPVRTDEPVRLTGVRDAQAGTIELYVGGNPNGTRRPVPDPVGSGVFTVGAATDGTAWTNHVPARIKDVRVWSGAVASSQQLSEVLGA
ncbi:LamG domain-containing protein [Streptomyces sp. NPDC127100]|uniref:LamG domain-containing protein n=1 Tax=Streptomyces sp. NPDC127100 TaxID=3347138 RepID=UPI003648BB0F